MHIVECIYITEVLVKLLYKAFNFLVNVNQELKRKQEYIKQYFLF